ncbi:hypothetical protein DM01DRAFT_309341 [Hesseltinella vesiculosa]|uniref:Uncharacterized protein n=1 Tax=Hesseltinella vesiculosa TaxID=101127 RepID=A0A1X2GWQ9_9FUNG|nr:hypothetical protein DM01DRAFT_309341 [Hesseltinella vesiculosa]
MHDKVAVSAVAAAAAVPHASASAVATVPTASATLPVAAAAAPATTLPGDALPGAATQAPATCAPVAVPVPSRVAGQKRCGTETKKNVFLVRCSFGASTTVRAVCPSSSLGCGPILLALPGAVLVPGPVPGHWPILVKLCRCLRLPPAPALRKLSKRRMQGKLALQRRPAGRQPKPNPLPFRPCRANTVAASAAKRAAAMTSRSKMTTQELQRRSP